MYDLALTQPPRDEDHLWAMILDNFQHARHVLEDFHVETLEEALSAEFRTSENGKIALQPLTVLAHRNVHEAYDQREYCLELGRATLPVVEQLIHERQLTPGFFQSWGVLQFCHGYLASHLFATNDDVASSRGARNKAREVSVDCKRVWVARILRREIARGKTRKEAERVVAEVVLRFKEAGGYGVDYPAQWFDDILTSRNALKTTYGKSQMPNKSLNEWADWNEPFLPPLEP